MKNILFYLVLLLISIKLNAQHTKVLQHKNVIPIQKFKPSKLIVNIGNHTDSIITVSVDEGIDLISKALKITDSKNNNYTLSSYQCIYFKKTVTEDEESGKVSPTTSTVANRFKISPLPQLWQTTIAEQIKTGDIIYFVDIVAKDAQNKLMFAPSLKIIIN